jgi:NTP pyrophosphatase (non-canonical NTP hydrolase)
MNAPLPNDKTATLSSLKELVSRFSAERGWHNARTRKNLSMAIAAEAAELMEYFLWDDGEIPERGEPEYTEGIRNEVADILIYLMEFANVAQIDLSAAVSMKVEKNALRFPIGATGRTRR